MLWLIEKDGKFWSPVMSDTCWVADRRWARRYYDRETAERWARETGGTLTEVTD